MKLTAFNISMFISCIVLGVLIGLNKGNDNIILSQLRVTSDKYYTNSERRVKLEKEISQLRLDYQKNYDKLNSYNGTNEKSNILTTELESYKAIFGKSDVSGNGIRVILKDGDFNFSSNFNPEEDQSDKLIHDLDVMNTLKELRNSGAQAITINGIRITNTSSVICSGPFISVDGIKSPTPYIIEAIGKPEAMLEYINRSESYFNYLKHIRKTEVSFEKVSSIKAPASFRNITLRYLSEVDNK